MCIFEFCQKGETRMALAPTGQLQSDKIVYPSNKTQASKRFAVTTNRRLTFIVNQNLFYGN
jgi:hypothetical protein